MQHDFLRHRFWYKKKCWLYSSSSRYYFINRNMKFIYDIMTSWSHCSMILLINVFQNYVMKYFLHELLCTLIGKNIIHSLLAVEASRTSWHQWHLSNILGGLPLSSIISPLKLNYLSLETTTFLLQKDRICHFSSPTRTISRSFIRR